MKHRISVWAAQVLSWRASGFYAFITSPPPMTSSDPIVPLLKLTCPVMFLGFHQLPFYLFFLANAAIYALVGMTLEILRRLPNHAS